MSDLFDEFMRELERRRAVAEGRAPRDDGRDPDAPDDDDGPPVDDEEPAGDHREAPDVDADDEVVEEPIPLGSRRRRGGGGSGWGPGGARVGGPDDGAGPPSIGSILRRLGLAAVVVVVVTLLSLGAVGIDLWTDAIWYESVGFESVFWTRLGAQVGLFTAMLIGALFILLLNLWLAGRLAPPPSADRPGLIRTWAERMGEAARQAESRGRMSGPSGSGRERAQGGGTFTFEGDEIPDLVPLAGWVLAGFAVLSALGLAGAASGAWETILLWINRVPFAPGETVTDPFFGLDISFFMLELPFFRAVQVLANGVLLAALVIVLGRYLAAATRGSEVFVTRVRVHVALLAAVFLVSTAIGYQLDKFELVYSTEGIATGVGYVDANARVMAYDVLFFLSGLAAALLVAAAFTRWIWPLGAILVIWFLASVGLGRLYPEAIQRFVVEPNQYAQEERFITNNIAMTRLAFELDNWERRTYRGDATLTEAAILNEVDTFTNARLWDYRPLQTTLAQLQVVRQYYDFVDVDTDRYIIDGELRQVMLSGRELARERNPAAVGWVNERVIYTHGIGMAMVPVNEVTREGQPRLWIRDLPPVSLSGAPTITEPRIYFGERDSEYVVTGAKQAEFDYPRDTGAGALDVETRWTADTGINLDTTLMRLLFALRFRDLDLLITDQVTADSQLLFYRTLQDRLPRISPFLAFDKDPYLVIDGDGSLVYVQDAYTLSNRFPHATPFDPGQLGPQSGLRGPRFNYLRNSVKITMNAYDGTVTYYVNDAADPLVRAWQGIFPELFRPISELSGGLEAHLRTPEEGFNVQTRMFGRYHVTQPLAFFNNTDLWTVPQAQTSEQSLPSEAYYVVMRMPGEPEAEFLLLQPMIAANRPNMIAWVAARNDPGNRGQVRYYQFPAETTIFGPAQIEARIDQDPIISSQVTLWSQAGSNVIRGNLIVVPVGDALVYLQPVYLQSTSSAFPEFQKIVVASPTTVVWGDTLAEALRELIDKQGGTPTPTPPPGPTPTPDPGASPTPQPTLPPDGELPGDVPGLIEYANTHFELAQQALRDGDFARYGEEIEKVEAALQRLGELSEVASPTP